MSSPGIAIPQYRKGLWDSLLDADMNVQYWTLACDRYAFIEKCLKIVTAVAASGTVAGWHFWSEYPAAWKTFSAIAAVASFVSQFFYPTENLKRMSELVPQWREILVGYELLWERDRSLTTQESWSKYEQVKLKEVKLDETRLPKYDDLRLEAYNRVCRKRGLV